MGNKLDKSKKAAVYGVVAVLVLAFALLVYGQWSTRPAVDGGRLVGFAQCLKDEGAVFYGTFWCAHCQDQKDLFGSALSEAPYVECSTPDGRGQLPICTENEITGYPTWTFANGSRVLGKLSLEELAAKTGCPLPK